MFVHIDSNKHINYIPLGRRFGHYCRPLNLRIWHKAEVRLINLHLVAGRPLSGVKRTFAIRILNFPIYGILEVRLLVCKILKFGTHHEKTFPFMVINRKIFSNQPHL